MGSKSDEVMERGRLTVAFMLAVPGLPSGLMINDHPDGGYIVTGERGFESYLGSPLACPSLREYVRRVRYLAHVYQEHLWKIMQEAG